MLIFIVMTLITFVIVTPIYKVMNRQMAEQKIWLGTDAAVYFSEGWTQLNTHVVFCKIKNTNQINLEAYILQVHSW